MNKYALLVFASVSVLSMSLWLLFRKFKPDFFSVREFRHPVFGFLIMLLICFTLFSYSYSSTLMVLKKGSFFARKTNYEKKIFNLSQYGNDPLVIDFIRQNIAPKSVILANSSSNKILPLLTDQYMAYNPKSSWEKNLNSVYGSELSSSQKRNILFSPKYQIDYVYLTNPHNEQREYFSSQDGDFKLIYNNQVQIYRLIK